MSSPASSDNPQAPRPYHKDGSFNVEENPYIEEPWNLIGAYFHDQHLVQLVRHQLESYNNFVEHQIVKTINMFNPIHVKAEEDYNPVLDQYGLEVFLTMDNFCIHNPQIHENNGAIKLMFPHESRLRNFTYSSAMTVDIHVKYVIRSGDDMEEVKTLYKTFQQIHIGKLPIMLKSNICVLTRYKHIEPRYTGECKNDAGGYFIINGSEKTVLGQEHNGENRVFCFPVPKGESKHTFKAEIKSVPDFKCISPKQTAIVVSSKNNGFGFPLLVQLARLKQQVPLFVVFRALSVVTDKNICEHILLDLAGEKEAEMLRHLQASVIDANAWMTEDAAVQYLAGLVNYTPNKVTAGPDRELASARKKQFLRDVLQMDLFPHCQSMKQKTYFLGYMANKLLQVSLGWMRHDDRDSYFNKRVALTGTSLNNLFRNYFNKLVKDLEKQLLREIKTGSWKANENYLNIINLTNIYKLIKSSTIENGLKRALSTGDFSIKQHGNNSKVGVAQVLNRLTYIASLSHLRRISTPTDKSGKLVPPRKLHSTSYGFICPAETPEGASVGVVKNLSYMAHVTIHSQSTTLHEAVMPHVVDLQGEDIVPASLFNKVKVFVNGTWVGVSKDPLALYHLLKDMKCQGILNIYTSVVFDCANMEIRVCNDSGRLVRPLLRVKNGNVLLTQDIDAQLSAHKLSWNDLLTGCKLNEAILEYVDPEEQGFLKIANEPRWLSTNTYTHCEIHASTMFGVVASCIPFPDHNQSPRNTYQCAQAKQAMGIYLTNFMERMDKTAYVLTYPTRPLVDTRAMNLIKLNENPSGCNINVAIMTHTGYNQEDSILINKGSIDRGLLQITLLHTEKDEDKQRVNGDEEIRCKPDRTKTKGMTFANYNKVNARGVVPENTLIENRDIIIAKVVPIKENRNDPSKIIKYEDESKLYRTTEETYIDRNYLDRNGDGYSFAKVRLRTLRKVVIGDKFSSRHGQKGTAGNIIAEEDMPFLANGERPDIIINPHAIPSRMTIGHIMETMLGKVLVMLGMFGDGTSFGQLSVESIAHILLNLGYEAHGNELLYNGLTGERIECSIFHGPMFYQRLKHMVNDKQHSRAFGPMVQLTRQPAEGRCRDGGLRFGEMERDCVYPYTPITLSNSLSVTIQSMAECQHEVLGWDQSTNTMIPSKQIGFMHKGKRECVKLTYEDGRTLICTPEHPLLTSNNEWVRACEIPTGQRVKVSITCPLVDFAQEMADCAGWELQVGDRLFQTDTPENYTKTLVLARLLGYLITDGHVGHHSGYHSQVYLGHMIDVESVLKDLRLLCETHQTNFTHKNMFSVRIPSALIQQIMQLEGILVGRKVVQAAALPQFLLDEHCPKPVVREFLGGLFGGDGHTCVLGLHRGKRDILTSVSFSQSKKQDQLPSLMTMMENLKTLLARLDITHVTIQAPKVTTSSKHSDDKSYQIFLHIGMEDLVTFHETIGFRYCCHKSQRLEAAVSYKRLRNQVVRQHNWLVHRVDELTNFSTIKAENPNKNVPTKRAIVQAVEELKQLEPLVHTYAIPSTHDITDHLTKGTSFGSFRSGAFPTAEEYLKQIGAHDWFLDEETTSYGVHRDSAGVPTMNLEVIDIRPYGEHDVYDIEVENTHSFLANGVVAHNCMVSHGAMRFTRGRMYDASDKYEVHVCKRCGMIAVYNDGMHMHHCKTCDNRTDFAQVEIPYACKLLFQELTTMNVVPRVITT